MTSLNDDLKLPCGAVLNNRIAKAAMTERLADQYNRATPGHATVYKRWAESGAGLLITGNVVVDRYHLERARNIAVDRNDGLDALRALAQAGTQAGSHVWMQINHPGRQSGKLINPQPVAPSAVAMTVPGFLPPRALTHDEIVDIIGRFAHVARTAVETGFTGVQIHGAHGYLVSQFLSNRVNQRDDQWGGSLQNRARFLLEIVAAIRAAVGKTFPISVKLNSTDFEKGGYDVDDCAWVAAALENAGIDLLEISGGTYERQEMGGSETAHAGTTERASTLSREAYFIEYAQTIRAATKLPLMITGGFRSRAAMDQALSAGLVDLIGLGRPMCADPASPAKLLSGEIDELPMMERTLKLDYAALGPNPTVEQVERAEAGFAGWYGVQIERMGAGQDPDLDLTVHEAGELVSTAESDAMTILDRDTVVEPASAAA